MGRPGPYLQKEEDGEVLSLQILSFSSFSWCKALKRKAGLTRTDLFAFYSVQGINVHLFLLNSFYHLLWYFNQVCVVDNFHTEMLEICSRVPSSQVYDPPQRAG